MAKLLIIDDDQAVRQSLASILREAGHLVLEASDGGEGVKMGTSLTFDLIITDIIMPGGDGLELIHGIRKLFPNVKIIAITAGGKVSQETCLISAQTLGADLTLAKPFKKSALLVAVKELLSRRNSS
jgi:DNA-binding response OmpR family regulator